jgi:secreted PhoX family phosphatase
VLVAEGFTPRIVARSGLPTVTSSSFSWHASPDGGGCFADPDGGWLYVSNGESKKSGGVGVLRFDAQGKVVDSYAILSGTRNNCSGNVTPWDTWLSCEEVDDGLVWECDPFNRISARPLPGLGAFRHESASVDPITHRVYLTEDERDACLYRFTPANTRGDRIDLRVGKLEVAVVAGGLVQWLPIQDPAARTMPLRYQVTNAARFRGGEGSDIFGRMLRFTTKRDNRVWQLKLDRNDLDIRADLTGQMDDVDDIIHAPGGQILLAEDGYGMRIRVLSAGSNRCATLLQLPDHSDSEITGLAFDPGGSRLYFSSQRGSTGNGSNGLSLELSGDFRRLNLDAPLREWQLSYSNAAV